MPIRSTTTVTRVGFDVDRYQALSFDEPNLDLSAWTFDGRSKANNWIAPPVISDQPRLQRPDLWSLVGTAVIVMSPEICNVLEPFVSIAGELLPLKGNVEEQLLALNILRDIDCLDKGLTDFGDPSARRLSFIEHRLPETGLFKVPDYDTVDIYHVERDEDHDSFRLRVERENLQGVSFTTVWSNILGVTPLDLFPH